MASENERFEATVYLIEQGKLLNNQFVRSGLKIALYLWRRSGVVLKGQSLNFLMDAIKISSAHKRVVASEDFTPVEVLRELADEQAHIRSSAAANPSTPPGILRRLALDERGRVRALVYKNFSTPVELLRKVVKNWDVPVKDGDARIALSHNPNAPLEILYKLAENEGVH